MSYLKKTGLALTLGLALALTPAPSPGADFPAAFPTCEAASYVDQGLRPLQLSVQTYHYVDEDEEGVLLRTSSTLVNFQGSPQEAPALQQALWHYNTEKAATHDQLRQEMLKNAREFRAEMKAAQAESFPAHESNSLVYIRRSDTLAVSLLEFGSGYYGGAHDMYGVSGRNFDTRTGKELTLGEVFADQKALAKAIIKRLQQDYPQASFMEKGGIIPLEKTVKEMVKDGSLAWTLDPWGATFYFNPYAIGSYMEGIFAATICFDEAPELFKERYRHAPAAYCVELMPYQSQRLAFAKGQKATLHVGQSEKGLLVAMNGKALDEPGEAWELRPVLVSLADGRAYLYVDTLEEGKVWEKTRVYDLTGNSPRRVPLTTHFTRRANIPEDYALATKDESRNKTFYLMADPNHFQLSELDKYGLLHQRVCKVGKDGAPEIAKP